MSLLNTASPWNSSQTIKRTPAIGKRKTQRVTRNTDDDNTEPDIIVDDYNLTAPLSESMKSTITMNEERGNTVNDMLNRITESSSGEDLVDFKPLNSPANNNLAKTKQEGFESPLLKRAAGLPEFVPSDIGIDALSNYNKSYEAGAILGKPYYSMSRSGNTADAVGNDGIMQKLNYITHILEDLQMEKTSNITEELILYSFLGVFVIFMVDSFARVGKYHR
jgi:hypothetical protein